MNSLKALPFLLIFTVAGCTATKSQTALDADTEAFARKVIVEKVDAAVQAQRDLAVATQEGRDMTQRKQALLDQDEVDIDYLGKAQPLLESLAHRYGYKYIETGKRVELKTVNLRVTKRSVVEVLRDISYQIDGGADVVLDKDQKILRLVFKKV